LAIPPVGAKVSLAVARYARIVGRRPGENEASRQQRVYSFMNDRSFADYIGDLPEDVEALFKPTVTRSSADLDEISAGAGVGYFSLVWNIGGRSEPEHRWRTIHPDRKHRSGISRSRATEFDGQRDCAQEELGRGSVSPGRIRGRSSPHLRNQSPCGPQRFADT
jgi:hypothetical protein